MLLYYITDRRQFPGDDPARRRSLLAKIAEATRAGVDYIQLRENNLSTRELEQLAHESVQIIHELRTANRELRTSLLINSRTDIALATGADGVHLRADDATPADALDAVRRSATQPVPADQFLIGKSCHSPAEVVRARSEGAHFAAFAPVFEKHDHPAMKPAGLEALRDACQAKIPVLALGGITLENAASCLEAGAAGIAAIRLFQENKIDEVIRVLREMIQSQTR